MITEIATIKMTEGSEEAFEQAMRGGGLDHLAACPGVGSVKFGRGVENPQNFVFVVEWESLEAHNNARSSESFAAFRASFTPGAAGGAMEHFTLG